VQVCDTFNRLNLTERIETGFYGLGTANTFLEVNPTANVIVIESTTTIGGVWAGSRLYPGLKTNNMLGTYEYSGFPMSTETYGVKPGEHIPGPVVHRYLNDYAKAFNLVDKIRLNHKVESAEHENRGGWLLKVSDIAEGKQSQILASKLVVATGLTSDAFLPEFVGNDSFGVPLFHPKDFPQYAGTVNTMQSVCVFGGTKVAWDVVYAYASKGVKVDWIIRESGHGPAAMAPPYVSPLKIALESLVATRFLTWFNPCIWGNSDGYVRIRSFLHGTALGRFFVGKFWAVLQSDLESSNRYDSHSETAKLKPWADPFFMASGLSILNYESDFFSLVRDGSIQIHIADIASLTPKTVHLSDGQRLSTDALISCTGWKYSPPLTFLPEGVDLGLPHVSDPREPIKLIKQADKHLLTQFPTLRDQPVLNPKLKSIQDTEGIVHSDQAPESLEPYRLYRFMVPPAFATSHDIAFAGSLLTITTSIVVRAQSLWIAAYLNNKLPMPPDIIYETVLYSRFGKWRYPAGFGDRFPDMGMDSLPYVDMLLGDLGLDSHRKKGIFKEIFEAYGPEDYKGLVDEWKKAHQNDGL